MTLGEAIEWVRGVPASLAARDAAHGDGYLRFVLSVARRLVDRVSTTFHSIAPVPRSPRVSASACNLRGAQPIDGR